MKAEVDLLRYYTGDDDDEGAVAIFLPRVIWQSGKWR